MYCHPSKNDRHYVMFLIETRKGVGQGLITIPVLAGKLLKIDIQYDSLDGIK
jgi:hypothetical protein